MGGLYDRTSHVSLVLHILSWHWSLPCRGTAMGCCRTTWCSEEQISGGEKWRRLKKLKWRRARRHAGSLSFTYLHVISLRSGERSCITEFAENINFSSNQVAFLSLTVHLIATAIRAIRLEALKPTIHRSLLHACRQRYVTFKQRVALRASDAGGVEKGLCCYATNHKCSLDSQLSR